MRPGIVLMLMMKAKKALGFIILFFPKQQIHNIKPHLQHLKQDYRDSINKHTVMET